jgi:hypothetical protein
MLPPGASRFTMMTAIRMGLLALSLVVVCGSAVSSSVAVGMACLRFAQCERIYRCSCMIYR